METEYMEMRTERIDFMLASCLLLTVVLTAAGCLCPRTDADALQAVRMRGVLRVGTTGDYCPMSYLNPETRAYEGFDAALAEDLAASLGVKIEYIPTAWPTLMRDTLAGKFDLALCGITVTSARKEQALMSDGYLENGKTILCRSEDAGKYVSLAAVNRPGVRVMENPGGLNEQFARENLPEAALTIHPVNEEIPALIASGKADVMITETMEAAYYTGKDSRLAAPLLDRPFTHGQLGALLPPGNETLLEYVNCFIETERRSGRLNELSILYLHLDVRGKEEPQKDTPALDPAA
jgi:cyclohexadienyl dehydratase